MRAHVCGTSREKCMHVDRDVYNTHECYFLHTNTCKILRMQWKLTIPVHILLELFVSRRRDVTVIFYYIAALIPTVVGDICHARARRSLCGTSCEFS